MENSKPQVKTKKKTGISLPIPLFHFVLSFKKKKKLVLADDKHTHNMMQPQPCLKIWRVILSDVLCWIFPKRKTLYLGQKVYFFATYFAVLI